MRPESQIQFDKPTHGREPAAPYAMSAEEIVRDNLGLVRKIAWQICTSPSRAVDLEDLIQIGLIALIEAAATYKEQGFAFATYAGVRIRGAMIDQLRKEAGTTRSALVARKRIAAARESASQKHMRQPTVDELAAELNISTAEFHDLDYAASRNQKSSIDDIYTDESALFADEADSVEELFANAQTLARVTEAIKTLPERQAMVLKLIFVDELNLHEAGLVLDVSAARICQIKRDALISLRTIVGEED